jgi:Protein of unknown function (DUF4231)
MGATAEALTPEKYINDRLKQYQSWYDRKAVLCKTRYLRMRGFSVVAGAIVPVLINMDGVLTYHGFSVVKGIVTIISLMVVISVSLESVLHYREQWKNYRSTEQQLGHEHMMYLSGIGRYKGLDAKTAFLTFVERIEDLIASENAATLNVMTVAAAAEGAKGSAPTTR